MATSMWLLILQSLQISFFMSQALGTRIPARNYSTDIRSSGAGISARDYSTDLRYGDFRLVYFVLPKRNIPTFLFGGPARFGVDLRTSDAVESTVEHVQPQDGCVRLLNNETLRGKIAIVQRGNCQFAEKALYIQEAGAVGGIVIDYNLGLSTASFPPFVMGSGSVTETIRIPMLFLYIIEGEQLINASKRYPNLIVGITGTMPATVPLTEELKTETPTTEEPATESSVMRVIAMSAEEQQRQLQEKTGGERETRHELSTMHIALICGAVFAVLILLAVSLGCWFRSTRRKSGGSPNEIHFSRL